MPIISSPSQVTQAIVDLLEGSKNDLGLAAVHYGDTEISPEFPWVTVESGPMSKRLTDGGTRNFRVLLSVIVTVLHGEVQSVDVTKKETEEFIEAIEAKIEEDMTLGDLVIFGWVSSIDPGVVLKASKVLRASRLTWEAFSRKDF